MAKYLPNIERGFQMQFVLNAKTHTDQTELEGEGERKSFICQHLSWVQKRNALHSHTHRHRTWLQRTKNTIDFTWPLGKHSHRPQSNQILQPAQVNIVFGSKHSEFYLSLVSSKAFPLCNSTYTFIYLSLGVYLDNMRYTQYWFTAHLHVNTNGLLLHSPFSSLPSFRCIF